MIKSLKAQTENELTQMRSMIMEKANEDQLIHAKNKEKNIALFNEVVRIGHDLERYVAQLQQINIDTKLQDMEGRVQRVEQVGSNMDNMRTMFSNTLSALTEKVESRLNQSEISMNIVTVW